jgi:hypothetical protein
VQFFLKGSDVRGILPGDQNDFWISTNKGLVHYFPTSKEYRLYTYEDGLAGTEFNYFSSFKDSEGLLYFGGLNGLTYFHPRDIKVNPIIPPLYFIQIRMKDSTHFFHSPYKTLSFSHKQNTFFIDFALLNYIKSNKNQYRYKLKDYDENWIETFEPSATYTNLPAGNYTFEVQGANNDGVWSKVEVLHFKVNPPFWKTWWAYTLYTMSID